MKVFSCKICKRAVLAKQKPSHCPYCGALAKNLIEPHEHEEQDFFLQPKTRKNLQRLADDKHQNIRYYTEAARNSETKIIMHLFNALESIEEHHLKVLEELGIRPNRKRDIVRTYDFDEDNVTEAYHRKSDTAKFLREILHEADDPYVTELLAALLEVEEEHVQLLKQYM
ncbi:MAG: hypothetical protein ACOCZ6_03640 [Nanoarchaeota archaeon]